MVGTVDPVNGHELAQLGNGLLHRAPISIMTACQSINCHRLYSIADTLAADSRSAAKPAARYGSMRFIALILSDRLQTIGGQLLGHQGETQTTDAICGCNLDTDRYSIL
jgi:hypothetical protein